MKTIVLIGQHRAIEAGYLQLSALIEEARATETVTIAHKASVTPAEAHAVRELGGEIWYCGSGRSEAVDCDRDLQAHTFAALAFALANAFQQFMSKTPIGGHAHA